MNRLQTGRGPSELKQTSADSVVGFEISPLLPTLDPFGVGFPNIGQSARIAESLGFRRLWSGDHLAFRVPLLESALVLASAAAATSTIQLGFSVYLLAMRQRVHAAKQIATLQVLSQNRIVLGVGVGGEEASEWWAAGVDPSIRGARTDEMLATLPALIRGEEFDVDGPAEGARTRLEPAVPVPPIWIGGRSKAALSRAARFGDVWLGAFCRPSDITRAKDELAAQAAQLGKVPPPAAMTVFASFSESKSQAVEWAQTATGNQYRTAWSAMAPYVLTGNASEVAAGLQKYAEQDLQSISVVLLAPNTEWSTQVEQLRLASSQIGL